MATKTLTITESAYDRLKRLKREGESFSELIERIVPQASIDDLVGILPPGLGAELDAAVRRTRDELDDEVEDTARRLDG